MYPNLKESKVHDYARARNPQAWQAEKLRKLGDGTLPQSRHQREQAGDEDVEEARSGRSQPDRSPQWRSRHSHSAPLPEPTPEHPDDAPRLKALAQIAKRLNERDWSPTALEGFKIVLDSLRQGQHTGSHIDL